VRPRLRATDAAGATLIDRTLAAAEAPDLPTAIALTGGWLRTLDGFALKAVGHQVVHGGPDFVGPVRIDAAVLERLAQLQDLAPLHQPNNLAPIRGAMAIDPAAPQVACLDTAFHRSHAKVADRYAIPQALHDAGVRRYGFHGLSYEYVASRLRETAPALAGGRVIVSRIWEAGPRCARCRTGAASRPRWASPRSTGCRWARGRASSTPASCCI
jgi:acetate kinase